MANPSRIPESFLEIRQTFSESWVDRWISPNPFISILSGLLRGDGVTLSDFSFNKDAANISENYLNVGIRRYNAAVRIGLDSVVFVSANPVWLELVEVFEKISEQIQKTVGFSPAEQQCTLAFHVTGGDTDFQAATALLVNRYLVGDAGFYGISLHRSDSLLVIEKSVKYDGAAFLRLQRTFPGGTLIFGIAEKLFDDQVAALRLIGIQEVPE